MPNPITFCILAYCLEKPVSPKPPRSFKKHAKVTTLKEVGILMKVLTPTKY